MHLRYTDVQWAWNRASDVDYRLLRLSDVYTVMFYQSPLLDTTLASDLLSLGLKSGSEFYLGGAPLGSAALGGHFL